MFVDPYLATITIFGGTFAPRSWAFCDGTLLSIAENTPLYALIGNTYGGDGQTNFALPDLRGRSAVHAGQGHGFSNYYIGQVGGNENNTLTTPNLPSHNHVLTSITGNPPALADSGTLATPIGNVPAGLEKKYAVGSDSNMVPIITNAVSVPAGGATPVTNISPLLAMNYIICVEGIFPSRSY